MDTNRLQPASVRRPLIRRGAVELGAALGLALTVLLTAALWYGEQTRAAVCADTLRLHILANSNSVDDQLLKLKVRDAVLEEMPAILQNAATKQEAEEEAGMVKDVPSPVMPLPLKERLKAATSLSRFGLKVTVRSMEAVSLVPTILAEIVARPSLMAVTTPSWLTVAMLESDEE